MKKIINKLIYGLGVVGILSGCSSTQGPGVYGNVDEALSRYDSAQSGESWKTKPYQMKIKPIIGSRQNDARVVIDTGKVLKIWVAPYKQHRTLIAGHDVYSMVEKPQFLVGEMVPSGKRTGGLTNCNSDYPFAFKDKHLETVSPKNRFKNKNIKKYVNNVYKAQHDQKYYDKKMKQNASAYDKTIKDYIK